MSGGEAGRWLPLPYLGHLGTLAGLGVAELTLRLTLFGSSRYYVWPPGLVRVVRPGS